MSVTCLNQISVGQSAIVDQLLSTGSIRRRLLDMGITSGTKATCLYQSPSGDPKAYLIRGAVIALRTEDAASVRVATKTEATKWA